MYIPKRYGESKIERCPFCQRQAFAKNKQGLAVCADHKDSALQEMKCSCGRWLDRRDGKFGAFFVCERCGTVNMKKALEMNQQVQQPKSTARVNAYKDTNGKDTFIRSDDPRFEFR